MSDLLSPKLLETNILVSVVPATNVGNAKLPESEVLPVTCKLPDILIVPINV